jgi:uncharacterized protein Yka (UPF0111/DUF47 family)
MLRGLIPRSDQYFDLFERLADCIVEVAKGFTKMLGSGPDFGPAAKAIKEIESRADSVVGDVIKELHNSFLTPWDRDEVYRLAGRMDDVIDMIEEAAARIHLYRIKTISEITRQFAGVLERSTAELHRAVYGLRDLRHPSDIVAACVKVHALENEGDELLRRGLTEIFAGDDDCRTLMQCKELYELLEDATDSCEDAASVVQNIILDHA